MGLGAKVTTREVPSNAQSDMEIKEDNIYKSKQGKQMNRMFLF